MRRAWQTSRLAQMTRSHELDRRRDHPGTDRSERFLRGDRARSGDRTFSRSPWDEGGEQAEFSFTLAAVAPLILGLFYRLQAVNGVVALALVVASISLYEWARHTIAGRGFYVIMSDHVPEALCQSGPYRLIRHPLYASYFVAYAAMLVAIPSVWTVIGLVSGVIWLTRGALHDERVILASPLGEAYAEYRKRTGMFLPFWRRNCDAPGVPPEQHRDN